MALIWLNKKGERLHFVHVSKTKVSTHCSNKFDLPVQGRESVSVVGQLAHK